jgi:DNA polymerase theta
VTDAAGGADVCAQAGHSVLIFCGSKAHCEKVAKHIAKHITVKERSKPSAAAGGNAAAGDEAAAVAGDIPRAQLLTELTRVAAKPDEVLKQVLPAGVAYHHSGLTMDERQLVERAFCSGA